MYKNDILITKEETFNLKQACKTREQNEKIASYVANIYIVNELRGDKLNT